MFEPKHGSQKYCCPKCRRHEIYERADKEKIREYERNKRKNLSPEQKKARSYAAAAGNYRRGKLPSWMYS